MDKTYRHGADHPDDCREIDDSGDAYIWDDPRPSRAAKPVPKSGYGHFVVRMVINDSEDDLGQISMCGSLAEYHTRVIALAEPDTVDVIEQVGPVPWIDENGQSHRHYIDHVVIKSDDRRLGLTDKPYRKVTPAFESQIAQVDAAGRKAGVIDRLHLVTEYARNPVKLYNADLFRGCRDPEPEVDSLAAEVVEALVGEASLQKLVGEINRGPKGYRALVRMIRSGRLRMIEEEKVSHTTLVTRGDALP